MMRAAVAQLCDTDSDKAHKEIQISRRLNPWLHLIQDILENQVKIEDLMFEVWKEHDMLEDERSWP
jgi:hypothetical protein